jgi:hypothetical protein
MRLLADIRLGLLWLLESETCRSHGFSQFRTRNSIGTGIYAPPPAPLRRPSQVRNRAKSKFQNGKEGPCPSPATQKVPSNLPRELRKAGGFSAPEDRSECEKKVSLTRLGSRPADFGGGKLDAFERTFVREQSAG